MPKEPSKDDPEDIFNNGKEPDIFKIRKRLRLYGKAVSIDTFTREVAKLLLGDGKKNIEPLSVIDVCRKLGYGKTRISHYKKLAIKMGIIEIDETTKKPKLPKIVKKFNWKEYGEDHEIITDPNMVIWIDKLNLRKDGKLTLTKPMINIIEKICNTCKITPTELLSKENAELYKTAYLTAYMKGEAWTRSGKYEIASLDHTTLRVNYAIASFCAVHGISWEKGSQIMSRKIVGHGNYADIRLNEEQFHEADKWIKEKFGIDSDLFRWFWFGIESGARFSAIYNMPLEWTIHNSPLGTRTFIMQVIEGKTIHIRKGKWDKFIMNTDLQTSLELLKKRGGTRIYESTLSLPEFRKKLHTDLKLLYDFLGRDGYFHDHPTHVLRHLATHRLLKKGNYTNHSLVARMLGWNIIDEMIRSYGEIPAEVILQEVDKMQDNSFGNSPRNSGNPPKKV